MNYQEYDEVESVVIVHNAHGYIAHLRFNDPRQDKDLSAYSKWAIYNLIEHVIERQPMHH